MQDEKKKLMLEALQKIKDKGIDQRQAQRVGLSNPDLASQNLAKGALDSDTLRVKQGSSVIPPEQKTVVGKVDKINTRGDIQPQISGKEFAKKQSDLDLKQRLKSSFKAAAEAGDKNMMKDLRKIAAKIAKPTLKALPLVGGIYSAMESGDVSAAVPGLDGAESAGMSSQAENQMIAETQAKIDYNESKAAKDRKAALAKLLK